MDLIPEYTALQTLRSIRDFALLPLAAQRLQIQQLAIPKKTNTTNHTYIEAALKWILRSHYFSASRDGGSARHFSLLTGWSASYPETTGYLIPTLLESAVRLNAPEYRSLAQTMLDWLVSIQFKDGSFQGGRIDQTPRQPVTFNTGQILLGLAAGVTHFGDIYREPMRRAADWLVQTQDTDGCWRKFPTPFASPGEKTYETHVSWGLLEAARVDNNRIYSTAAFKNILWALQHQQENGWIAKCCLEHPKTPLTHCIGYVLRGLLEGYKYTPTTALLKAIERTAQGVLTAVGADGFLAGRLDCNWKPAVNWSCLTGNVQIAACFFELGEITGSEKYRDAGLLLNAYVKRTVSLTANKDVCGAIQGSYPIQGAYCAFEYPNWATKFFVDALFTEEELISKYPTPSYSVTRSGTETDLSVLEKIYPKNPFCTAAFIQTRMLLGEQPILFLEQENLTPVHGLVAFERQGRLRKNWTVHSVPNVSRHHALWTVLLEEAEKTGCSSIAIQTYAAEAPQPPAHARDYYAKRNEFVVSLLSLEQNLSKQHHRNIKKSLKHDIAIIKTKTNDSIVHHLALNDKSMNRRSKRGEVIHKLSANEIYAIVETGLGILYQAIYQNEVVSSILLLQAKQGAYYHSGGTNAVGMRIGASQRLLYEAAQQLRTAGFRTLNLGGARNDEAGLMEFKLGFGPSTQALWSTIISIRKLF